MSSRFPMTSRGLTFDERAEVERITEAATEDPEGAAWTIAVLCSILARNGIDVGDVVIPDA